MRYSNQFLSLFLVLIGFAGVCHSCQLADSKFEQREEGYYHVSNFFSIRLTRPSDSNQKDFSFSLPEHELRRGNAAPFFYRAGLFWNQRPLDDRRELWENSNWFESDLKTFPREEVNQFLSNYSAWQEELERAALYRDCDWNLNLEELTINQWIKTLLPELDCLQQFGQANYLLFRIALHDGDYAQAEKRIQVGFRIAAATGSLPGFVSGIRGNRSTQWPLKMIAEWSAQPGAPDFESAVRRIRLPLVNLRERICQETEIRFRTYPILQDPMRERSHDEWRHLFQASMKVNDAIFLTTRNASNAEARESTRPMRTRLMLARLYPVAKEELRRRGFEESRLEAMPPEQVVAIQTHHVYKCVTRPFRELQGLELPEMLLRAENQWKKLAQEFQNPGSRGDFPIEWMEWNGSSALPSSSEQDLLSVLIIVQHLRNHLHQFGKLPDSLKELEEIFPTHSRTRQPFQLIKENGTYFITSPVKIRQVDERQDSYVHVKVQLIIDGGDQK